MCGLSFNGCALLLQALLIGLPDPVSSHEGEGGMGGALVPGPSFLTET